MKKAHRPLSWLLLVAMIASLGFTAAFADGEPQEPAAVEQTQEPEPTATPEPTEVPDPTEAPTPTPEPTEVPDPTEAPTPTPESTEVPDPTEAPKTTEVPDPTEAPEETQEPEAVVEPNTITAQPESISVVAGTEAVFTVAGSSEIRSCQWQYSRNGRSWYNLSAWSYGSDTTLSFLADRYDNGYSFRVVVTFADGTKVTSDAAVLTVTAPYISSQPESTTVAPGGTAEFTVGVEGSVSYVRWQYSRNGGRSWSYLSTWTYGSDVTLRYPAKEAYDGYLFRAYVTCVDGTRLTSAPAKLTVAEPLAADVTVNGAKVSVAVEDPSGALPAGAALEVKALGDEDVKDAVATVVDGTIGGMLALDIGFGDVEPDGDVKVTVKADEIKAMADAGYALSVVHIKDNGEAEILPEEDVEFKDDTLTFTNDEFSSYIIVGRVVITDEEGSFTFETDAYTITVSYTKEAKIPIGTELIVREIDPFSDEYVDLWNKTILELNHGDLGLDELNPDARVGLTSAAFFDITLMTDEGEFEPEVPLQVNIHFNNGGLPQFTGEESGVIHFRQDGKRELIQDVDIADSGKSIYDGMPDGVLTNGFTYMQGSFSITGFYTTGDYIEQVESVNTSFAPLRATNDDTKIAANKSVTDEDGDGIYDLKLSVTGNSNKTTDEKLYKSNVVLVIDVSGSMKTAVDQVTYEYDPDTYDPDTVYYIDGYTNQAWHDDTGWYLVYSGTKYYLDDIPELAGGYTIETRFGNRLEATQAAARALVRSLLKNNTTAHPDTIEISIIKFANKTETYYMNGTLQYNGTKVLVSHSTTESDLIDAINGLEYKGGTHWDAALSAAKTEIDSYEISEDSNVEETNYVIFLTDGYPTMYGNDNGGGENNTDVPHAFNDALAPAQDIVDDITTLFTIFAYGSATGGYGSNSGTYNTHGTHTGYEYLTGLTNYAYDEDASSLSDVDYTTEDDEHCFDASNTTALQSAFQKIADKINNNVGFGGVAISDGLSVGSTNSTISVDGTTHPESFVYTVYDTDAAKTKLYTVTFTYGTETDAQGNKVVTGAVFKDKYGDTIPGVTHKTVTTELPDPTEADPNHTKTVTTEVYSVPYGTGAGATTYMMTPATIQENGMIDWNLAGLGILEKWTYELSFKVWPNQAAYDIAADLNNGLYNNDLETAIADYVAKNKITQTEGDRLKTTMQKDPSTGLYVVNTNYSQNVSYHQAEITQVEGQDPVTTYENPQSDPIVPIPNPISLTGSLIPMEKRWGADLAISELQELVFGKDNKYTGYNVTLKLQRDGADYMTYTFPKLNSSNQPVDKNGNVSTDVTQLVWQQDAAIAPGRMVTEDPGGTPHKTVHLTGVDKDGNAIDQDYYIINDGHEYLITEDEGSDLHFEFSTDVYHPMLVDGQLMNIKFSSVGTNGVITANSTAEIIDPEMTSVYATNTLKGGLNIRKVVSSTQIVTEDDEGVVTFAAGTMTPVADCTDEFTFEITLTKDGAPFGTPSDQYSTTEPSDLEGWSKDTTDPEHPFWYRSGFSAYNVFSGSGSRLQRGPIPADGKLTLTMPANGEIRIVNLPAGVTYTVKEIEDTSSAYHYAATASAVKTGENVDGSDILDGDPVITTANTVTGTIVGNRAKLETYYNWASYFYVYHSATNQVEKISFADARVKGSYDAENSKYVYSFNIVAEVGHTSSNSGGTVVASDTLINGKPTYSAGNGSLLYGGYFKAYGESVDTDVIALFDDTTATWATYSAVAQYTLSNANAGLWTRTGDRGAYTVPGNEMHPVANGVYYLKEVSTEYLKPFVNFVYGNEDYMIHDFSLVSAIDDGVYRSAGYTVDNYYFGTLTQNYDILYKGSIEHTYTVQNVVFPNLPNKTPVLKDGYLTIVWGSKFQPSTAYGSDGNLVIGSATKSFPMTPTWFTMDKVYVTGLSRTVNLGDGTYTNVIFNDGGEDYKPFS